MQKDTCKWCMSKIRSFDQNPWNHLEPPGTVHSLDWWSSLIQIVSNCNIPIFALDTWIIYFFVDHHSPFLCYSQPVILVLVYINHGRLGALKSRSFQWPHVLWLYACIHTWFPHLPISPPLLYPYQDTLTWPDSARAILTEQRQGPRAKSISNLHLRLFIFWPHQHPCHSGVMWCRTSAQQRSMLRVPSSSNSGSHSSSMILPSENDTLPEAIPIFVDIDITLSPLGLLMVAGGPCHPRPCHDNPFGRAWRTPPVSVGASSGRASGRARCQARHRQRCGRTDSWGPCNDSHLLGRCFGGHEFWRAHKLKHCWVSADVDVWGVQKNVPAPWCWANSTKV